MAKDNVHHMADYARNTNLVDIPRLIEETKRFHEDNPEIGQAICIFLDRRNGRFDVYWHKARMLNSEALAALELVKDDLIAMLKERE